MQAPTGAQLPHQTCDLRGLDSLDNVLPRLVGYFVTRVRGRIDVAEDLAHDTILAAAASHLPDGTPVMAWMNGIARHKLVDYYRAEGQAQRRFGGTLEPDTIDIGASQPLPRLNVGDIETRDDIVSTLDRIAPR